MHFFTPYESVLGADDRYEIFLLSQKTLPWQPVLCRTGLFHFIEVSQDLLGRFSQSLHLIVGIEFQMINLTLFDIFRDFAMATNLVGKLPTPCTYRSVIPKRSGISLPQCAH